MSNEFSRLSKQIFTSTEIFDQVTDERERTLIMLVRGGSTEAFVELSLSYAPALRKALRNFQESPNVTVAAAREELLYALYDKIMNMPSLEDKPLRFAIPYLAHSVSYLRSEADERMGISDRTLRRFRKLYSEHGGDVRAMVRAAKAGEYSKANDRIAPYTVMLIDRLYARASLEAELLDTDAQTRELITDGAQSVTGASSSLTGTDQDLIGLAFEAISALPEYTDVIVYYFGFDPSADPEVRRTHGDVAELMGLTVNKVRRLKREALEIMRLAIVHE